MDFMQLGLQAVIDPFVLLLVALGVFLGIIFGAIPGLTATLGVALLLPFTYGMNTTEGLSLLIGIYVGAISGGLVSATLLKIPGTPSSIMTTLDGYPMAAKGEPNKALCIGVFASFVGGMFSMVALALIAPQLAKVALMFGPWEYFSLGIFGITVIISVSTGNLIKGVLAGLLGIVIAIVGQDPVTAFPRFTFGSVELEGGFPSLATLLGFFAVSEILSQISTVKQDLGGMQMERRGIFFPPLDIVKKSIVNFVRSSIIGTWIGILPGAGGSIASFLAYDQAKRASKTPEKFGTGHYEGIVASETANNAVTGGALIPMMTLGIPGDVVTAVLLSGLTIHGLQPGPLLFKNNGDVVGAIFVSLMIANFMMYVIEMGLMSQFAKVIHVPKQYLLPAVLLMSLIGVYAESSRIFTMGVMLVLGLIGYILSRNGFPLPPIVLGYILTPMIEKNWRLGLMAEAGNWMPFFTRPLSLLLLVLSVASIALFIISSHKQKGKARAAED